MNNIYEYTNYRKFVTDRVQELKLINPIFSQRKKLRKNGITNPSFILVITKYNKNINVSSANKIANFLELTPLQKTFFVKLVEFNQELDLSKKKTLAGQLMRHSGIKKYAPLTLDKYEYFSNWINIVVYESISSKGSRINASELSRRFRGMATAAEIETSVNLLMRLGLVEVKNEKVFQVQKSILSDDEISWLFAATHYEAFFALARNSLENDPIEYREFSSLTFQFPKKKVRQLKDLILDFRNSLVEVISDAECGDEVFQIMLQMYPITKQPAK